MAYNKSAGVYITEQDVSIYSKGTPTVGAAIITPTVKGKSFVPTMVTSFSEYETLFGSVYKSGSDNYEYLGSITAREYFANGGSSLLVTKISTGSYAPATSTVYATGSVSLFTIETLSDGAIMNNSGSEIALSSGTLVLGSQNNIRWEIPSVNTTKGTFDLIVRRGDDNSNKKIILEAFSGLTLDPNSNDYIGKRIGDSVNVYDATNNFLASSGSYDLKSNYIRIKSIDTKMYDMLNPNGTLKTQYTSSLPITSTSGTFTGASDGALAHPQMFFENISSTNSQGFGSATTAYDTALSLLSNSDEYNFKLLFLSGVTATTHPTVIQNAVALCEARGDVMLIADPTKYGDGKAQAITQASGYNTSYAAMYYPWLFVNSSATGKSVWVPPSTMMGGVYAFSDSVSDVYFAPAGYNRGYIPNVIKAERKLSKADRDDLQEGNVNPLATFPDRGIVAYGQKTLQFRDTSLDRVNVRRLLIDAKYFVKGEAGKLTFDNNTQILRLKFINAVTPYFESVQQGQGLYAFRITMDDTNNTNETIDRHELNGKIQLQPTKSVEYINISFVITPTGVEFSA